VLAISDENLQQHISKITAHAVVGCLHGYLSKSYVAADIQLMIKASASCLI
jgi:hypothetical protein